MTAVLDNQLALDLDDALLDPYLTNADGHLPVTVTHDNGRTQTIPAGTRQGWLAGCRCAACVMWREWWTRHRGDDPTNTNRNAPS